MPNLESIRPSSGEKLKTEMPIIKPDILDLKFKKIILRGKEKWLALANRGIDEYKGFLDLNDDDLKKREQILDLGSGTNQKFAQGLQKTEYGKNKKVINFDLSLIDKQRVLESDLSQKNVAGSWINLPFKDNSFDLITSLFAFPFHCYSSNSKKEIFPVFKEIVRVLKKGGEFRLCPFHLPEEGYYDVSEEDIPKAWREIFTEVTATREDKEIRQKVFSYLEELKVEYQISQIAEIKTEDLIEIHDLLKGTKI